MTGSEQDAAPEPGSAEWLAVEWRGMQRRMLACIATRSSEMVDRPLLVDTSLYTDPARHRAERERLFLREPLLAGFSSELPEPGCVLHFEAFGPPVFVLRREDGGLDAFRNVCPHRGARLVEGARIGSGVVCPFHAWRFGTDGRLQSRPQEAAFACEGPAPELTRLPVAERYGLVFLRLDPAGEPIDVDAFLGPMAPLIRGFGLAAAQHVRTDAVVTEANWKLVVDVSCEGYHVPATHPATLSPQLVPFITIHDSFGRHHRFASPARRMQEWVGMPEEDWPVSHYSAVHYLFPNTILTYSDAIDGGLPVIALNRSFPGEHIGETTVLYSSYRPASAAELPEEAFMALHEAVLGINLREDLPMVGRVWANYQRLPVPAPILFGRNEMLLQRYHADVAEAVGMPLRLPA